MTPKQERFVEEYLVDMNATQAAKRAGYSAKTAYAVGHENLNKPEIAVAISQAQANRAKRLEVTGDRVIEEFAKIAFANMGDFVGSGPHGLTLEDVQNMRPDQTAAIAEVHQPASGGPLRVKLHDKRAALDALAKHLGLFVNRHEVSGKDGAPISEEVDKVDLARRIAFILAQAEHTQSAA